MFSSYCLFESYQQLYEVPVSVILLQKYLSYFFSGNILQDYCPIGQSLWEILRQQVDRLSTAYWANLAHELFLLKALLNMP